MRPRYPAGMTTAICLSLLVVALAAHAAACSRADFAAPPEEVSAALVQAVWEGDAATVEALLAEGARGGATHAWAQTALTSARQAGQAAVVQLLRTHRAKG